MAIYKKSCSCGLFISPNDKMHLQDFCCRTKVYVSIVIVSFKSINVNQT